MIFPSCEWLGAKSKIALTCSPLISDSSAPCAHQMQTPGWRGTQKRRRLECWAESHLNSKRGCNPAL